jgi:hypothetical protein
LQTEDAAAPAHTLLLQCGFFMNYRLKRAALERAFNGTFTGVSHEVFMLRGSARETERCSSGDERRWH